MGTVEDAAGAALFLASGAASFTTGHLLQVNGGLYS
jgi:NAD(P)-dependent dehydrogenase (short-subunit alcohol dehydrogenase family)